MLQLPVGARSGRPVLYLRLAVALSGVFGVVVLAVGLSVGVSRCYLGVHYPGDIAMGWLLAVLSAIPFGLGTLMIG